MPSFLSIRSNPSTTSAVLIRDLGFVVDYGGAGSIVLTEQENLERASQSQDLRSLSTDDAFGAGSSTLILNDGSQDVLQEDIDAFLANVQVNPTDGGYGIIQRDESGVSPEVGPTGDSGPTGDVGPTGPSGDSGVQGSTGPVGDVGATGETGPQGVDGPTGPLGLTGVTGDSGPQGVVGATGPLGVTGATGDSGDQGIQGVTGNVGGTGPTGDLGPTGPAITGETGPSGPGTASGGYPGPHAPSHQHSGDDEVATGTPTAFGIPKAATGGQLAVGWIPPHADTHQDGGSDEVATGTPTAFGIPKAATGGQLDPGWISASSAKYDRGVPTQNNNTPYFENGNATYATAVRMIFEGSGGVANRVPDTCECILSGSGTGTIDVRIYDQDNLTVIAEATGLSVTAVPAVLSLGTVSNIPSSGPVIFTIQVAKGSTKARIHFMHLYKA